MFLLNRIWTYEFSSDVTLGKVPKYELHAAEFKAKHDEGVSIEMIASQYGMTPHWVQKSIRFAETGERPKVTGGKHTGVQAGKTPAYKAIAADVSRLKAEQMSNPQIIAWLVEHSGMKVGHATIRRAWAYANPDAVKTAVNDKKPPAARARHRHLPVAAHALIKSMLDEGHDVRDIAEAAGCSERTVYRARQQTDASNS